MTFWRWRWRAHTRRPPIIARLFKTLNFVLFKAILPYEAEIQRDVRLEHRLLIGDDVLIGAGAIIVGRSNQTLTIGNGARIGAGAVVTGDVGPGQTMVGSPARPLEPEPRSSGPS